MPGAPGLEEGPSPLPPECSPHYSVVILRVFILDQDQDQEIC